MNLTEREATIRQLLPDLPVLVALARTGSVTGAADELRMPQPSASRAIARLTRRAGVQLTARQGRGLVVTEAGRQLADAAAEALAVLGDGLLAARRDEAARDAFVAVAYQAVLGESYLPRAIARFRARHPSVRFGFVHGSRARCIEAAVDREADVAILADPPQLEGLRRHDLFTEPLVVVAPRQHPLALPGRAVTPEQIRAYEIITLAPGYGMHDSVRRLLDAPQAPLERTFEVDDSRVARGLVAAGVGITILPSWRGVPDDRIVEVPIDHPDASRRVGALVAQPPGAVVEDFVATLATSAGYGWSQARPS